MVAKLQAQNVGVGTISPLKKLHIVGDNEALRLEGQSNWIGFAEPGLDYNGFLYQTTASFILGTNSGSTKSIRISPAGTNAINVTSSGKVGIGTFSPTNPLSFPATNEKKISLFSGATGDIGMGVYPYELRHYTDNVVTDMIFGVDDFVDGFTENMRIKGNGNVGIGNNNPTQPLSFAGTFGKKISLFNGASGDVGMGVYANEFRLHSDYDGAAITFGYDNFTSGFSEKMRIAGSGNVGIGITNPAEKLSVNGRIRSKEVLVETANWPDYVFSEKYTLPTLNDVENLLQRINIYLIYQVLSK
jgi:hypothetical protein